MDLSLKKLWQYVWAALCCVILAPELVYGTQQIVEEPESTVADQGATIIFICKVKNRAGVVQWTRNRLGLGVERNLPGLPRYTMIGGEYTVGSDTIEEYSLRIEDVRLEDDGEYQCQVSPTETVPAILSRKVTLTVRVPPQDPVIEGGHPIKAIIMGVPTNISCHANGGKPGANITWYKDNSRIAHNVYTTFPPQNADKTSDAISTVTLTAKEEDSGKKIECWAMNDALRQALKTSATLDVQFPPRVTISHNYTRTLRRYDYVRVTCTGLANPPDIKWRWFRNGELIRGQNSSHLDIPSIDYEYHENIISCEATNEIGGTTTQLTLEVQFGPIIDNTDQYKEVDLGGSVTLECNVIGNPQPYLIWRKAGEYQALSKERELHVPFIDEESLGVYVCTAASPNSGFADVSEEFHLLLKGPPEILSEEKQYAAPEETISIECLIHSVPKPDEIEWFRHNIKIDYALSGKYTTTEKILPDGVKSYLNIKNLQDADFGAYNCSVYNSYGNDSMVINLLEKEIIPLAYIVGGVCGGVAALLLIAGACIFYHRYKSSDTESYAETDSNTEIKKREKSDSPSDFTKSTLMDQWRQDLNFHCPTDYDEGLNKDPRLNTSGYGTLKSDHFINAYENHNGHLFSDYTHRGDETLPVETINCYNNGTYGTSSFRSVSRTDFSKPDYNDPYRLPPADISTTQLATNV